jgi:hypothetical protein
MSTRSSFVTLTRSSIAIILEDNSIIGTYCHYDGYLEGVGTQLVNHFTTTEEIVKLIKGGDIRCIENGEVEYFIEPYTERSWEDYDDFLDNMEQDFNYLFVDGEWVYDKGDVREDLGTENKSKKVLAIRQKAL